MKVFGHPMSTCTRKVLCLLAEKNAPFDMEVVDLMTGEHKGDAYRARQPFGQIPSIDDDGFALDESRAIRRDLDGKLEGPLFTPKDPKGRATMEQWISIETSNFAVPAMKIVSQKIMAPMRGATPDEAIIADGRKGVERCLDVMETTLGKSKYIAGDALTLADIGFLPYVEYLFACGEGGPIDSRPNVKRWWTELSERPSWKKATGKN